VNEIVVAEVEPLRFLQVVKPKSCSSVSAFAVTPAVWRWWAAGVVNGKATPSRPLTNRSNSSAMSRRAWTIFPVE